MRVSVNVTDYSWPEGPTAGLARVARAADEGGLDTLWVSDHLIQATPGSRPDGATLEAYATLAYLAARTERIRLGALVSAVTHRPAALLVKAVTTLDVLSVGRAWFGAGYHEEEARMMSLPLPPVAERSSRAAPPSRSSGSSTSWSSPPVPGPTTPSRASRRRYPN
jgi:alkanesulfonate monooxygenase SsuD/methylene tetrahydromethanopterin reductase-like flavin-dependent oxidoreductase (luciferase family)